MITSEISNEQLLKWEKLYKNYVASLRPNRICGRELNEYFRRTYRDAEFFELPEFAKVINLNAGGSVENDSEIKTYCLGQEIYIGIDIKSGFFQVECEDIEKCIPIWDDLFVTRGLNEEDLKNYVLVGQYIELRGI